MVPGCPRSRFQAVAAQLADHGGLENSAAGEPPVPGVAEIRKVPEGSGRFGEVPAILVFLAT